MPQEKPISPITRRQLLQAAGGITFLALNPTRDGAFASSLVQNKTSRLIPPLPVFTALPYLQPGTASSKLISGKESLAIPWQTDGVHADFTLEYGADAGLGRKAVISKTERLAGKSVSQDWRFNHVASLTDLDLHRRYQYRVKMNGEIVLDGYFTTRKPRGTKARFVAYGDNSCGAVSDHAIAYQAYLARPDFVMNTGDNVYSAGLDSEYARYFFPVYNAGSASANTGAPLLRSVPYYSVIANHDINRDDGDKGPIVDFDMNPDALAYFTAWHFPISDFKPSQQTPLTGKAELLAHFLDCAGARYPNMSNYSFDYGDAHFLCLDANTYIDPTDSALQKWIETDLSGTDAAWKIAVYHHPAFTSGTAHYEEQHMRVLAPIFEKQGVDVVLNGHVHNYQRSRPIRFAPAGDGAAKNLHSGNRMVPGTFTVDRKFDGKTVTKPEGILHIVTGAGGNHLYDPECNENPSSWLRPEDSNADYVARFISDRHSLSIFDIEHRALTLTQIDEWGREIDQCRITKA